MPGALRSEFTLNGSVPVLRWYIDSIRDRPLKWTPRSPHWSYADVEAEKQGHYGETDAYLYAALKKYSVCGKDLVILGSENPWYECICTYHGARVTTIEYRPVDCRIPELEVMTPDQLALNPRRFDVALSISSVEHDGLGRYGESVDPNGDLRAMAELRALLEPEGFLLLAVPIGRDAVVWNAHRIYGRLRFPLLTKGWEVVDSFGFRDDHFEAELGRCDIQPVWVLKPRPLRK
jgi:hypothetical protein